MCFLFAMIAFVTNLAAPVGTIWAYQYDWAGMLGNLPTSWHICLWASLRA